jgi:hypothetical protein
MNIWPILRNPGWVLLDIVMAGLLSQVMNNLIVNVVDVNVVNENVNMENKNVKEVKVVNENV